MKSVIVITLILALIYYFEIGEAYQWDSKDPKQIMKYAKDRIKDFVSFWNSSVNEMNRNVILIRHGLKTFVNKTIRAGIIRIQYDAAKKHKTGNNKTDHCINLAMHRLEEAARAVMNSFDDAVTGQRNHTTKIYNNMMNRGKSIITYLEKIIANTNLTTIARKEATADGFLKYTRFRRALLDNKTFTSRECAHMISMLSDKVPTLETYLNRKVKSIIVKAKTFIVKI